MAQTGHVLANRQFVGAQGLKSARAIRGSRPRRLVISNAVGTQTAKRTTKKEALQDAREDVRELIKSKHCNPILVRVAWHDSGTYDKDIAEFPQRGGANGSIRFYPEITHAANAGLPVAVKLLKKVADKYDGVSYADLFQMASAQAIELAGGPHIPLRYGRTDAATEEECAPEGRLPGLCIYVTHPAHMLCISPNGNRGPISLNCQFCLCQHAGQGLPAVMEHFGNHTTPIQPSV
ncbi:putative L-ascorbate peroxidase 7, chloroplastic, variant 3 [Trebouxia sp. C0010 RCD-2024]